MQHRRHTPEQTTASSARRTGCWLRDSDVASVARHLEGSEQTYHRWRNQYGGLKADDAKRLKELEKENAQLKRRTGSRVVTPRSEPCAWSLHRP